MIPRHNILAAVAGRRARQSTGTPLPDGTQAVYLKPAAIGGSNINGGTSWADAVATLAYAMTLLNVGAGRVYILAACPGMAYNDTSLTTQFNWTNNTHFYGGFAGTEAYWEQRNVWANLYKAHSNYRWGMSGCTYLTAVIDGLWGRTTSRGYTAYNVGGNGTWRNCFLQGGTTAALYGGITTLAEHCIFSSTTNGAYSKGKYIGCLFYACGQYGMIAETQSDTGGPLAVNCTFADNTLAGIAFVRAGTDGKLRNCIFWGNAGGGVLNPGGHTITYAYCDSQDGVQPGSGNISADPLFVGGGNYRLQAGSPCVNTGSNALWPGVYGTPLAPYTLAAMDVDLDWLPRKVGTIDMGPYERQ